MPIRKRPLEAFDPNKSDPEDEDYDAAKERSKVPRPSKHRKGRHTRKRRRMDYDDDSNDDDISESESVDNSLDDEEAEEDEEEAAEVDPRTGRPIRKSAKKKVQYQESDSDSIDPEDEEETRAAPKSSRKAEGKTTQRKSLMITLKTPKKMRNPRGVSIGSKKPADTNAGITRRSSRIANDDREGLVALTNSGNHVEITRPATMSPELATNRNQKGGKGLKKPPSVVHEAEDEPSVPTKQEGEDEMQDEEAIAASEEGFEALPDRQESNGIDNDALLESPKEPITREEVSQHESAVVPDSNGEGGDDEDEDDVITKSRRNKRRRKSVQSIEDISRNDVPLPGDTTRRALRSNVDSRKSRKIHSSRKRGIDDTSDFEPAIGEDPEEDASTTSSSEASPQKNSQENVDSDSNVRRQRGFRGSSRRVGVSSGHHSEDAEAFGEAEEIAVELAELNPGRSRRGTKVMQAVFDGRPQTRKRKPVDYRILRPDLNLALEEDTQPVDTTPSRRGRGGAGGGWQRSLFSTYGPFGGAGGPAPVLGGPGGGVPSGMIDSDSSDDENVQRPKPIGMGGTVGMTPTSAAPPGFGLFPPAQPHSVDPLLGNLGRVKDKDKQVLANADPLGVKADVNFDSVGGLDNHINQLKEMVTLPLLYPEVFQRFNITPPRGVLFHGPPGTGKTLLARALASSVSSQGKKVTFYMRKGADTLSKWVGEAERQLRLLFEEARKSQPSIIFFDEIDGLAPVRSSKQDQIHASIVSTLLALMDGMDGRGQVIIIGATNRPDAIDPALRRPGRFDREFYFPLPGKDARRKILEIHTKGWEPQLSNDLLNDLAEMTKGYGGADLRALCTEAALNAVQRRYPQIYTSNEKLLIKPETVSVAAKDFMISVRAMVPSSERSSSSTAAPLTKELRPLLNSQLEKLKTVLADTFPQHRRLTALEEAQFEDATSDGQMSSELLRQDFERSRMFRPRLLLRGAKGMGQRYLAAAVLHHFERVHVQSFDLPTLYGDPSRSAENILIQLFAEVKRNKPSVVFVPDVDVWYNAIGSNALSTFISLLGSLHPTDPVLLLAMLEEDEKDLDDRMINDLFSFSKNNQFHLQKPTREMRADFFRPILEHMNASPLSFPESDNRKKRILEPLPPAPVEPSKAPQPLSKEELKAQKKRDRHILNVLKLKIQPIMDQVKLKYKKFRTGVIDENAIRYLFEEEDPNIVTSDLPREDQRRAAFRPYEKSADEHGEPGLLEQASGKFFYNMETVTIERRLANGYYKRPRDFLSDIKKMTKDAKNVGDTERLLKASELQANVEVDIVAIEAEPNLLLECEGVYQREQERERVRREKMDTQADRENPTVQDEARQSPRAESRPSANLPEVVEGRGSRAQANGVVQEPRAGPERTSVRSSLTNGISDLSDLQGRNAQRSSGSNASKGEEVNKMTNSDERSSGPQATQNSSFGPSAQTRPMLFHTGAPASLKERLSYPGSLSQKSAITPMVEGTVPSMYENSASTTSSDKHMTGSSGPLATQSSHGKPETVTASARQGTHGSNNRLEGRPDLSVFLGNVESHSQLPDTQEWPASQISGSNSSQLQSSPLSQVVSSRPPLPPPPPRNQSNAIHNILNEEPSHPQLLFDVTLNSEFEQHLIDSTSRCTVEQLEQISSGLMSEIWKSRGNWNRIIVVQQLKAVLNLLLQDMMECQHFGPSSAELLGGGPR